MITILIIILAVALAVVSVMLYASRRAYEEKNSDCESLLKAILSPICIVDEHGKLVKIINERYVKESVFDMENTGNYDMTSMMTEADDRRRFMNNLKSVIREQASNYVNQDFAVRDKLGTSYRVLMHIVYYKAGLAYVFINRIRQ